MADDQNQLLDIHGGQLEGVELNHEMRTSFLEYSMSVIVARALPDVRDGLKPVHRRILYAMNESGITPSKPHKKSAWTVGEVIGKYHPHGDTAVYDTMVRLAQDFSMRLPLVDGHGNFGSIDGDPAAAMRYTESRLTKGAMELLRDLDKDTVDWQANYDDSLQEPTVLPARFPNLLVNGSSGIAVGMATNIPPHNLGEVVDGLVALIDKPDITTEELIKYIPGPDFPTGAQIMGTTGIKDAYTTGRGSITMRAKAHIEQTSTGKSRIVFTEIPYQVNKAKIQEKIAQLVGEKKLEGISDMRDESDRKGMRLVIDVKRDAIPQVVLNNLYKHTQLQSTFGVINLALVDGIPRYLTLQEMLFHYLKHQREVITRRTKYELKKAQERAHILQGLMIALNNIDEVIKIIRSSADDKIAKARLIDRFGLTEAQTDAILEMRLRRLTGLEREKIQAELEELEKRIAYYQELLANPHLIDGVIKDEVLEIKEKFADKRRTEISFDATEINVEDLIAEEDMVVTLTKSGYVKRLPVATYRQQKRGGKGKQGLSLKDNDFVENLYVASTHDFIFFFSTKGKVYRIKVHEIPVGSRQARGTAVQNLIPLDPGEKVAAAITGRDKSDEDESLIFATKQGMVKKTKLSEYANSRRDGIIAIKLKESDELIAVRRVALGDKIMLLSTGGKVITWDESEARPMGRGTMGVKGITLKEGQEVLSLEIVRNENASLFVITDKGYGKRTKLSEYPVHKRGGQGVFTIALTEKKGALVGMKIVGPQHELVIISEDGVVIRVKASDAPLLGRSTQGVKIMNLSENDHVTALTRMVARKKKAPKSSQQLEGQESLDLTEEVQDESVDLGDNPDETLAEDLLSDDYSEEE
ncbi:MAG: DNA gyrase subunit A [Coriobacteriia bacterium]|nr:DNA gyrase subunit A [Coriobacteriia bacterium]